MKKIGVIIPCYNEEESLPLYYEEMSRVMDEMGAVDFELLFVNDGSKDKTLTILKELSQQDSRVRYLSFSRNFGKEAAILAGLEHVDGDYVTLMDADLQDPPQKLIEMYDVLEKEHLDIVGMKSNDHKNYGFIRKFFTFAYYKIVGSLEADPLENKISNESPFGKAIIGRKVGEEIEVESPTGSYKVQIKSLA